MHVRNRITAFIFIASAGFGVNAQNLFKCGAVFQDKPCDTDLQQKYSRVTGSFTKEQVTASADAQCADLGARALPIIQARLRNEPVQNLHAQVEQTPMTRQDRAQQKDLITAVYSRSGSAVDLRAGIETDCMEKKRVSRASASAQHVIVRNGAYTDRRAAAEAARSSAEATRAAVEATRR